MAVNRSIWLLGAVAALVVVPLIMGGKFEGSDDQATKAIEASHPGYTPWFTPLWEPPSGEIESLLFALQAALGAGVIGYVIGRKHGQAREREPLRQAKTLAAE
jgi:cobalt/nickel transport protein